MRTSGAATGLSVGTIKAYCSRNDIKQNQPEQKVVCERCGKAPVRQIHTPAKIDRTPWQLVQLEVKQRQEHQSVVLNSEYPFWKE